MGGRWTTLLIAPILFTSAIARSLQTPPSSAAVALKHDSFCNEHVQVKYCRADFVLKATVRSETATSHEDNRFYRVYSIAIKTQIKITPQFMTLTDDTISTLYYIPAAQKTTFSLRNGTKYIISGSLKNINGSTRMVVESCDWVQSWSSIGHRHKASLRKSKFEQGCSCQISLSPPIKESPSPQCSLHYRGAQLETAQNCYQRHSFCVYKSPTKCSWSHNQEVKQCLLTGAR